MADATKKGDLDIRIVDPITQDIAGVNASNQLKVEASFAAGASSTVKIQGDTSGNIAEVTASGELKTVNPTPAPPSGTDAVSEIQSGDVNSTTGIDTVYTITNGKELTIQRLSGGAETSNSGSLIELFEDPNGDKTVLNLIEKVYVSGASDQKDLSAEYSGDGTRRILMRRRNFGGGTYEITGAWSGYEE